MKKNEPWIRNSLRGIERILKPLQKSVLKVKLNFIISQSPSNEKEFLNRKLTSVFLHMRSIGSVAAHGSEAVSNCAGRPRTSILLMSGEVNAVQQNPKKKPQGPTALFWKFEEHFVLLIYDESHIWLFQPTESSNISLPSLHTPLNIRATDSAVIAWGVAAALRSRCWSEFGRGVCVGSMGVAMLGRLKYHHTAHVIRHCTEQR